MTPTSTASPQTEAEPLHEVLTREGPKKSKEVFSALTREATHGRSPYKGAGTQQDPYIIEWLPGESADPYQWSKFRRWMITLVAAIATLCVAFASSVYSGATLYIAEHFGVSRELSIAGVSLFVLGFALGPLVWAPLSEMYGRRLPFIISYGPFFLFHLGGAVGKSMATVLVTRFFAGAFGASLLTNAGGIIADIFGPAERGLATSLFAASPFMGPVLGPIVGGFAGQGWGWRSVFWIMFTFSGVMYIAGIILIPETYAPTLLRQRAAALQKASTKDGGQTVYYVSKYDLNRKSAAEIIKINLTRPFVLLFMEPIVLLFSIYIAIVYGTLYLFFTAYPLVFQSPEPRGYGFSTGIGGLPFIGLGVGIAIGTALAPISTKIYVKAMKKNGGRAPPEARLPAACLGAIALPISLFWFAWTSRPSLAHWIVPCIAGIPFGFGMVLIFTAVLSYLIDTYLLFAASALAANSLLRSLFGAAFPLFSTYMYDNLDNQWAGTLIAFLALICVPIPFLFYRYGPAIRAKSKFAPTLPPPKSEPAQTEKVPQPPENEALEPEYASDAGHEAHEQRRGADAV